MIEVLIPHTRRVRGVDGVDVQRCRDLARRTDEHAHPPRTTVKHTVLDLAEGGTVDEAIALAALACREGLTWDEALLAALSRRRGRRWGTLPTEALVDIGAGAQSTFEVRYVRDVERAHGLPPGRPQQPTGGGRRRHDCGYAEQRVPVELDGMASHSSPQARLSDGRRDRATVIEGRATLRAFWPDVAIIHGDAQHLRAGARCRCVAGDAGMGRPSQSLSPAGVRLGKGTGDT